MIKDKFKVRLRKKGNLLSAAAESNSVCVHVCLPPPLQGFNEGLEEVCKTQKVWAVPDKEQRDFIRQAQKKVVSQAYTYFLHR